jgi:hypothetical protein
MSCKWLVQQQEEILGWVIAHPDALLSDCSRYFALSEYALRELFEQKQFKKAFRQRLEAERRAGRGNPDCPKCGGPSARISYGYPNWQWHADPLQVLWHDAKQYVLGGCDGGGFGISWRCNECAHEWGNDCEATGGEK